MRSVFFVSRCSNGLPDRFWHMGKPEEILALLWSTQTSTVSSNKLSALATRGNVGRPLTFWRYFGTNRLCLGIKITFIKKIHDQTVSSRDGYPFHLWDRFWPYAKLRLRNRKNKNTCCNMRLTAAARSHACFLLSYASPAIGAHARCSALVWTGCCRLHAVAVERAFFWTLKGRSWSGSPGRGEALDSILHRCPD